MCSIDICTGLSILRDTGTQRSMERAMCGVQVKDLTCTGESNVRRQISMERAMCGVQVKDRDLYRRYGMGHRDLWREQCAEYRSKILRVSTEISGHIYLSIFGESNVRSTGQRYKETCMGHRDLWRAMCGVQVKDIERDGTQRSMESNVRSTGQR